MSTRQALANFFENDKNVPVDTKEALEGGKLEYDDQIFYVRYEITGDGGTVLVHDNTDEREFGVTNIDRGKLQKFYIASVGRVRVAYASTTDEATTPAGVAYSPLVAGFPPALRNAELLIKQDGAEVAGLPVSNLGMQTEYDTDGAQGFELETAFTLIEQKETTVEIRYPKNVNVPQEGRHFVEIWLIGSQTKPRTR